MAYNRRTKTTTVELSNEESVDIQFLINGRIATLKEEIAFWEASNPSWLDHTRLELARIGELKTKVRGW